MISSKEVLEKCFDIYYQFNSKTVDMIAIARDRVRDRSMAFAKLDANTIRFVRHIVKIAEDAADLNHLTLMRKLSI